MARRTNRRTSLRAQIQAAAFAADASVGQRSAAATWLANQATQAAPGPIASSGTPSGGGVAAPGSPWTAFGAWGYGSFMTGGAPSGMAAMMSGGLPPSQFSPGGMGYGGFMGAAPGGYPTGMTSMFGGTPTGTGPAGGIGFGDVFPGVGAMMGSPWGMRMAVGAAAYSIAAPGLAIGASYGAASAAGLPWNAAGNYGAIGGIAGGILGGIGGALSENPMGIALGIGAGSEIGRSVGNWLSGSNQGANQMWVQAQLARASTGMQVWDYGAFDLVSMIGGGPPGAPGTGVGTAGMGEYSAARGFQLLGPMGMSNAATRGNPMLAMAVQIGAMTRRAGNPVLNIGTDANPNYQTNPGFEAQVSALSPMLSDPTSLSALWARASATGGDVGVAGTIGAMAALGPTATYAGINAIGNTRAMTRFRGLYQEEAGGQMSLQEASNLAAAAASGVSTAFATGGRSDIMAAYGQSAATATTAASIAGDLAAFWGRSDTPAARSLASGYAGQRASFTAEAARAQFGAATSPADPSWTVRTTQLETSAAIQSMDPFLPWVSAGTRRGLVSQYTSRLGEIAEQTAGSPAAQAQMAGAVQQLQVERAQQMNALKWGEFTQLLDLSVGRPSGPQSWGFHAASLAALQANVPGAPTALGGSGSLQHGDLRELNRTAEAIRLSLESNRGMGANGGHGNPFSLAPNRSNRRIGN